ncbi:MAG TPA: 16S rRNA (cytosine(1402)-N(4))-methyltransferase RsmH, partial [Acidimicrobiales bacterium]|nr:16S rRNA (cytosine(1402)-N(4))-methyltransferase RsmH [Acidimicrobiales bacterium]
YRARVVRARYDDMAEVVAGEGIGPVVGVLFDLGVSSPQLDRADRGFSYRQPGPLDMRMDPSSGPTAGDIVNGAPVDELTAILRRGGEERLAGRIARAIVAARPFDGTLQLAEVVAAAVPAPARRRGHPARRVFQALRIEVNDELAVLDDALDAAGAILTPGGRCCAIAYHSGEDRLVKDRFRRWSTGGCECPPGLPCVCGAVPRARLITRGARRPSAAEVEANRRSESARFRAVEWLEERG